MPNPVKIMAILSARPGREAELRTLLDGMIAPCRAEPGNLHWDIWQDRDDAGRFVLDELYSDAAAAAAHRQTPHFANYVSKVGDLADRMPLTLDPVDIG